MSKKGSCALTKTHLKDLNLERVQRERMQSQKALFQKHI